MTPYSNSWDPYDKSYMLNEDSYLDNRGDMILPSIATESTLVADAHLSAALYDFRWNKIGEISAIDSIVNTSMVAYTANDAQT